MQTIYDKLKVLDKGHWEREGYIQRVSTRDWHRVLLNNDDDVIFEGRVRKLVGKSIGFGIVEVAKRKRNE
jgi:hypothetical protein